jgi:ribosome-associated protein
MIFERWRGRSRGVRGGGPEPQHAPEQIPPRVVPIREDSIRLGQFLKLADMIDAGSDAKPLLADGLVEVNGEVDVRRGRQLVKGDVVTLGDQSAQVG